MSLLAKYAVGLGVILVPFYAAMILVPGAAMRGLRRFPRSRVMGAVLSVAAFIWAGGLLHQTPLGRFEAYRKLLYLALPVVCVLVNTLNSELLAPRALGALLLLIPAPLLAAARWHPSPWRYLVILAAYGAVIKGMMLLLSPYVFRRVGERLLRTEAHCRTWGGLGLVVAVLLVVLGVTVY